MAGPWFVDDAGDGTTEDSWATADTSIKDLDAEKTFASGEIVYFGSDMQCQATHSANLVITGPAAGEPVYFISSTVGSGTTVSYSASTTYQIDTSEGAYDITFDGSFALYGLSIKSGDDVFYTNDFNEYFYAEDHRVALPSGGNVFFGQSQEFHNYIIDLSGDGTTPNSTPIFQMLSDGFTTIHGLSFVNAGYRTGTVFLLNGGSGAVNVSGADFTGFDSGCEIHNLDSGCNLNISNSITASTWTPTLGAQRNGTITTFTNTGPADDPTYFLQTQASGVIASSSSIYRTGGATVEEAPISFLVTTASTCGEGSVLILPWIYGEVASTGSKTFTVYITNDTADFTDAQVWLEVEYLGTADEANTTLASDHRVITTTAANQTDDTTSTWNGTGPSFTYKQSLAVTATIGETGQYRARVCVGVASIASSRYFYIDPKVTVS